MGPPTSIPFFINLLTGIITLSNCQFPRLCEQNATTTKVCCPVPPGFDEICAGANRGVCSRVSEHLDEYTIPYRQLTMHDERFPWPRKFFDKYCYCFANFYGPGCHHCKLGWYGHNCDQKHTIVRKEINSLTHAELSLWQEALDKVKTEISAYQILKRYHSTHGIVHSARFEDVTWWQLFEWHLAYATDRTIVKSNMHEDRAIPNPDTAHGGPGFATWNRYFLLWVERVCQQEVRNTEFALPYWDWTKGQQTELPSKSDVNDCLEKPLYDPYPDRYGQEFQNMSFRRCLEGLDKQVLNYFHLNHSSALNNTYYFLHMGFLDMIFQTWFQMHKPEPTQFGEQLTPPGQSLYSFIVPFLPLVSHASVFSSSEHLGYRFEPPNY